MFKLKIKLEENLRFAVMFDNTRFFNGYISKLKSISKIIFVNFKYSYILTSYLLILFLLIYHIFLLFWRNFILEVSYFVNNLEYYDWSLVV